MSLTLNISRDEFFSGLATLQNVTGKKGTIAILSNILIKSESDSVTLIGTDLEIGIKINIPAEILNPGSITLPAKKLFEIIRESISDQIHLEVKENNWVKIKAESSDYNLAGMPGDEFPSFPEYSEESLIEIDSATVSDLIEKTIFSVAQEGESQFNLTAVLVEKDKKENGLNYIRMVSSDGHRLTLMESIVDNDLDKLNMQSTVLIPRKGLQEIRKFCENNNNIFMGFEKNQAVIKKDNYLMIIRLMNGDFPDYKNIINMINMDIYLEIDRNSLIHSMKRMNLFTEDRFNAVKFFIDRNIMILSSESMDIGNAKDEIEIDYSGEALTLGFNGKYFIDALTVMKSNKIKVFINTEESPCLLQGDEDEGFMGIIMPMKI
ncbi:MAG: DNA polymerase III subunit beta [Proteobacteria bacterium]|nr:DNA polymerase III subunit beta [Pseudomonadota bacterium]MBU1714158.1 DNA polymerase III subunit beta [Pseudomonadota bacterium]